MHISDKQILIVIPARYKSSRFPGKPLAKINGIEMIRRTYDRCVLSGHPKENIVIATDSNKILKYCKNNNLKVFLVSVKLLLKTIYRNLSLKLVYKTKHTSKNKSNFCTF